jgi:hypothetical protein
VSKESEEDSWYGRRVSDIAEKFEEEPEIDNWHTGVSYEAANMYSMYHLLRWSPLKDDYQHYLDLMSQGHWGPVRARLMYPAFAGRQTEGERKFTSWHVRLSARKQNYISSAALEEMFHDMGYGSTFRLPAEGWWAATPRNEEQRDMYERGVLYASPDYVWPTGREYALSPLVLPSGLEIWSEPSLEHLLIWLVQVNRASSFGETRENKVVMQATKFYESLASQRLWERPESHKAFDEYGFGDYT